MINLQDYLRIKERRHFSGSRKSTLRNWGRNGKIPTYRHPINRYRLYKKAELETVLHETEQSGKRLKDVKRK